MRHSDPGYQPPSGQPKPAARPRLAGPEPVQQPVLAGGAVRGVRDDADGGPFAPQTPRDVDAVEIRHLDVDHEDVWVQVERLAERVAPVLRNLDHI